MHSIPFYKPSIGEPEINEVVDCLRTGWLTTGPKAKQFEAEFARYIQYTHAVAVNSCTAALHLALEAVGLKAGQTVVRSEEHTSELQSQSNLVCRLLLEQKKRPLHVL